MKYYEAFLKKGCFGYEKALEIVGAEATTKSILQQYVKNGYLARVKRGLYVAINLLDDQPAVNKFVIASHLTDTAFVSHHAAFEYYGYANQVSYDIPVSSKSKFRPLSFQGYTYRHVTPKTEIGVTMQRDGVRVSDVEQTVLDCINDFESGMGFEELTNCIGAIPSLKDEKLLYYLNAYDTCFLYQKTGYILQHFRDDLALSNHFFEVCKERTGKSTRYFMNGMTKGNMDFDREWNLIVPQDLWVNTAVNGGNENADI